MKGLRHYWDLRDNYWFSVWGEIDTQIDVCLRWRTRHLGCSSGAHGSAPSWRRQQACMLYVSIHVCRNFVLKHEVKRRQTEIQQACLPRFSNSVRRWSDHQDALRACGCDIARYTVIVDIKKQVGNYDSMKGLLMDDDGTGRKKSMTECEYRGVFIFNFFKCVYNWQFEFEGLQKVSKW